jgi:peptidoglycan/LPS O-acetylase OafA/YrhL
MKSLNLPFNPRIDQLRWLAVTIVFLFHFYQELLGLGVPQAGDWAGLVTQGHTGVALFFALSGFLFMQIAQHQREIRYLEFLRNRCLRILPLFLVIFMTAVSIGRDKFTATDLLFVLATNLGLPPTSYTAITGAAWSISLEFSFYLVFPYLARFTLEQGPRYLLKLLALMVLLKLAAYTVNEKSTLMYFSTQVGRFDQFLIGMLAAELYQRHAGWLRRQARWLAPLALLLAVANSAMQAHYGKYDPYTHQAFWIWWSMLEASVWSLVIVAWVAFGHELPEWLERAIDHGGKISFSFYLLHMAVLHVLSQFIGLPALLGDRALDIPLAAVLSYAICWGVATLSYGAIEEPFLRLRRKYGSAG